MTRGPKTIPTHLKLLHGNPGKRALPDNEPKPALGVPEFPAHLDDKLREPWDRMGTLLMRYGVVTDMDATAMELLVCCYADYLELKAKADRTGGAVWIDPKAKDWPPRFVYSPIWAMMNREHDKLTKLLEQFGMTPAARARVTTTQQKQKIEVRKRG